LNLYYVAIYSTHTVPYSQVYFDFWVNVLYCLYYLKDLSQLFINFDTLNYQRYVFYRDKQTVSQPIQRRIHFNIWSYLLWFYVIKMGVLAIKTALMPNWRLNNKYLKFFMLCNVLRNLDFLWSLGLSQLDGCCETRKLRICMYVSVCDGELRTWCVHQNSFVTNVKQLHFLPNG
jgi:hypothetical protein